MLLQYQDRGMVRDKGVLTVFLPTQEPPMMTTFFFCASEGAIVVMVSLALEFVVAVGDIVSGGRQVCGDGMCVNERRSGCVLSD